MEALGWFGLVMREGEKRHWVLKGAGRGRRCVCYVMREEYGRIGSVFWRWEKNGGLCMAKAGFFWGGREKEGWRKRGVACEGALWVNGTGSVLLPIRGGKSVLEAALVIVAWW